MTELTKDELTGIMTLVAKNRDSGSLQQDSGLSYLDSINLKGKIEDLIKDIKLKEQEEKLAQRFDISFESGGIDYLVVKDNQSGITHKMDVELLYSGDIAEYNIVDRENEISNIEGYISECKDDNIYLMREDLQTLNNAADEEFVLAYYGTNGFITKADGAKSFNEACEELVDSFVEFNSKPDDLDMG